MLLGNGASALPRFRVLSLMEAHLENQGPSTGQVLPLARWPRSLLDRRLPCTPRVATPCSLPTVWPGSRDDVRPHQWCHFSRQVWHDILSWLRLPCSTPARRPDRQPPKPCARNSPPLPCWCRGWSGNRETPVLEGAQASCTMLIKEEATL